MIDGFPARLPVSRVPRRFSVVLALFVVVARFVVVAVGGAAGCGFGLATVFSYRWVWVPTNTMASAVRAGAAIMLGKRDGQTCHRGDVVLAHPCASGRSGFTLLGRVTGLLGAVVTVCAGAGKSPRRG